MCLFVTSLLYKSDFGTFLASETIKKLHKKTLVTVPLIRKKYLILEKIPNIEKFSYESKS